jgi:hypothetical protein
MLGPRNVGLDILAYLALWNTNVEQDLPTSGFGDILVDPCTAFAVDDHAARGRE